MIITPSLPGPIPSAREPDRAVGPVRPANRSRDALEGHDVHREAMRHVPPRVVDDGLRGQVEAAARPVDPNLPARAHRALAAYSQVAEGQERSRLQSLLGFDEFA